MKIFKILGYGSIIFVILVVFGTMLQSIPQKQEQEKAPMVQKVNAQKNNEILKKEQKGNQYFIVVWDEDSEYTIVYYLDKDEWEGVKVGDIYQHTAFKMGRSTFTP